MRSLKFIVGWDLLVAGFSLSFMITGLLGFQNSQPPVLRIPRNAYSDFVLAFLLCFPAVYAYTSSLRNRALPISIYVYSRLPVVALLKLLEYIQAIGTCQDYPRKELTWESCENPYTNIFLSILVSILLCFELHLCQVVWSYLQKLKMGYFGQEGAVPQETVRDIGRALTIFSVAQPVKQQEEPYNYGIPHQDPQRSFVEGEVFEDNNQDPDQPPPIELSGIPVMDFTNKS